MTKWLARCGIIAALCLLTAQTAGAVECRLGPDGSITTWLVAPTLPLDPDAGFAKDLLPKGAGEASGFQRAEGAGPVKWRAMAFNDGIVNLYARCLRGSESVIYAACELRAREGGEYDLFATFYANGAVWLDGKPVIESAKMPGRLVRDSAKITLEKGKTHHLLLKLKSTMMILIRTPPPSPPPSTLGTPITPRTPCHSPTLTGSPMKDPPPTIIGS